MTTGIYQIRNTVNDKRYIGSADDINFRARLHKNSLDRGDHHSQKLQRAWNKYGGETFVFETIIVCRPSMLLFYEQRAIDGFMAHGRTTGYNISPTAGSPRGVKRSAETRAKIGAAVKGRICSDATRERFKGRKPWNKGIPMRAEAKAKMAAKKTGLIPWNKGKIGMKLNPISLATRRTKTNKTHCPQGHLYSGENLYQHPRDGRRGCRICRRAASVHRKERTL